MSTKTLQIATGETQQGLGVLFAVAEDGSVWRWDGDDWEEIPAIEVEEGAEDES